MNNKMIKKVCIIFFIVFLGLMFKQVSNAEELTVFVDFDGKNIEMSSETPDMTFNVKNILPGESKETKLNFISKGKNEVDVEFLASIQNGKELADILSIKIIKLANGDNQLQDEEFFNGKYGELMNMGFHLNPGKTQSYKIITYLPKETGNEFQKKECLVKFNVKASGVEDNEPEPTPTPDTDNDSIPTPDKKPTPTVAYELTPTPTKNIIQTEEIKPIKTGESNRIIYAVVIFVVAIIILVLIFISGKINKRNEE